MKIFHRVIRRIPTVWRKEYIGRNFLSTSDYRTNLPIPFGNTSWRYIVRKNLDHYRTKAWEIFRAGCPTKASSPTFVRGGKTSRGKGRWFFLFVREVNRPTNISTDLSIVARQVLLTFVNRGTPMTDAQSGLASKSKNRFDGTGGLFFWLESSVWWFLLGSRNCSSLEEWMLRTIFRVLCIIRVG